MQLSTELISLFLSISTMFISVGIVWGMTKATQKNLIEVVKKLEVEVSKIGLLTADQNNFREKIAELRADMSKLDAELRLCRQSFVSIEMLDRIMMAFERKER